MDSLYLDCGFGSTTSATRTSWCDPYKGWQRVYSNDLYKKLEDQGFKITEDTKKLVLGGEVCMWTETV